LNFQFFLFSVLHELAAYCALSTVYCFMNVVVVKPVGHGSCIMGQFLCGSVGHRSMLTTHYLLWSKTIQVFHTKHHGDIPTGAP